jgi:hypothetical protein
MGGHLGLFSKIFGGPERRLNKMFREAEKKVAPLQELGRAIVVASARCAEQMQKFIKDDTEIVYRKLYVHFEFIYFFMHLTNRTAFRVLGHERRVRLQQDLGPAMANGTIETYFAHWPEEMKHKMQLEFLQKLNDTEIEYSTCREFYSSESPLSSNTLCTKLGRNVADLAGSLDNPAARLMAMEVAMKAYEGMGLDKLIEEAGKVS